MKKAMALTIAVLMLMGTLAACGGSASSSQAAPAATSTAGSTATAPEGETVKAYVVALMSGGAAWGQFERGFSAACADYGWDGQYLSPQAANSTAEMVNLCETAITNGADVLITTVTDSEAFADVLIRAKEAGITLVGAPAPDENLDASIGTDPTGLGNAMAQALVDSVPADEPINVVTMQTDLTAAIQIMQRDAFEAKLFELRPDANIVSYEECNSNAATAQDKMLALYLANPDLNAMVSIDSYAGLGAAAFVEENALQGKFYAIGIDDAPEILRCIQNDTMVCTVAQMWYQMGYGAVELSDKIMTGADFEVSNDSGCSVIYKDGVEAWAAEYDIDLNA